MAKFNMSLQKKETALKTIQIAILKKKTEIICSPFNDHFYLVNIVTKICL